MSVNFPIFYIDFFKKNNNGYPKIVIIEKSQKSVIIKCYNGKKCLYKKNYVKKMGSVYKKKYN
jgi:hypothetical protein